MCTANFRSPAQDLIFFSFSLCAKVEKEGGNEWRRPHPIEAERGVSPSFPTGINARRGYGGDLFLPQDNYSSPSNRRVKSIH